MDPGEALKTTLADAGGLARFAAKAIRAARARAQVRARGLESRVAKLDERGADLRLRRSILAWIPGAGFARRSIDAELESTRGESSALKARSACEWETCERLARLVDEIARHQEKLGRASKAAAMLGRPPSEVLGRIVRHGATARTLRQRGPRPGQPDLAWSEASVAALSDVLVAIRDWARAKAAADRARVAEAARHAEGMRVVPKKRVYLPIPHTMAEMARKAGALHDADAPKGASPWFVTLGTPLEPFRRMLPLAGRPTPAGLSFPPVPMRAAGQNLWGMFDGDSWGHIRRQAYAASGRRCMICGGRSEGFLSERLYPERERQHPIECHEVWDWRIPRESDGIGIQTLRQLLVVCRNCHPMFHSQFFMRRAQEEGIAAEVAAAIEKRRMLVNRETREQVNAGIEAGAETLRRASGVDTWIVDLSHLAGQGYMTHHSPVMMEGNAAGLPPERIAGLAFDTDAGRSFPARAASDIRIALLDGQRSAPAEVIAFRGR